MNRRLSLLMDSPDFKEVPVEPPPKAVLPGPVETVRVPVAARAGPGLGNRRPSMPVVAVSGYEPPTTVGTSRSLREQVQEPELTGEAERLRRMREAVNPTRVRQQFRAPPRQTDLDRGLPGINLGDGDSANAMDAYLND